ncbi:MAG: PEP-CTERM system histidine kinase PrsK [Betaproteobacteria bacterium]|nr:PEP-CTERM system histidine kinase PrsK [Betaproteobacteria bacterium]
MTEATFASIGVASYAVAAAGWLLLAGRAATGFDASPRRALLLGAALSTAAWAALAAFHVRSGASWALGGANAADVLRYACWFAFVATLLQGDAKAGAASGAVRWLAWTAASLAVAALAMFDGVHHPRGLLEGDARPGAALNVGLAVAGLAFAEHLYRRTHPQSRWRIKPLAAALVATFGFDLYVFADALLFARVDPDAWVARGAAHALVIPLVVAATSRSAGWTAELHLSRQAILQSFALLFAVGLLLAIAAAGYLVRYVGGDWGRVMQIVVLFAAVVFVVAAVSSGSFRSWLRVFAGKHLFPYRYDYREEWLRFTRTLASDSAVVGMQERAIRALADLVESTGGALWLADERGVLRPAARLSAPTVDGTLAPDAPLPAFLARTGWIVSLPELAAQPGRYAGLEVPEWLRTLPGAWLVVPLPVGSDVVGFVVLLDPRSPVEIDWEVRDLLKAAARAAASYLQQLRATEALVEARKFDAFNRMSAFVVHDLKHLVAQLTLMLRNAERHRDNPEFQRDMLQTVANVAGRMNALMLQLRAGGAPVEPAVYVDLAQLARRVAAAKAGAGRVELALEAGAAALCHEARIEHVIGHLLQNALDATQGGGAVRLAVRRDGAHAVVEVEDGGVGMTADFVRERLFKPFETTKPAGMGIGVYESRQYVASLGGSVEVDSVEGRGTRVAVRLPAADSAAAQPRRVEQVA